MERSDKKRRGVQDGEGRLPSRPRPDEAVPPAANDAEVEEFFTILGRMRDASRRLSARQRAEVAVDGSTRWNPEFSLEDFTEPGAAKGDSSSSPSVLAAKERPAESVAPRHLDLNVEPGPEGEGSN
ncbi:hypothetical protein ZIOFF_007544 [Zingiber officinale]|uniref:Uncharacterized protein n=2 Tax=Zingiber officinale TaxID=94328 RepID=A0A8J5LT16_ZINOF|nr:hypothetical protein ZIOFF_007544 [Zingiber officinale]